jgi:hypothetical protein
VGTKWNGIKKAQGVFGGGVMVVCSLVLMWAGVSSDESTNNQLSDLVEKAVEIDPNQPDPNDNGKIVIAASAWRTDDVYEDEFLKPSTPLIVRRRVEMLQWVERRKENSVAPAYALEWVEGQVDFFNFQVPQGHENPLLQINPRNYQSTQSRFGDFDGSRLLDAIRKLQPLALSPEMLKDPSLEVSNNKLVIRRDPNMQLPSLGDMRVWYEVLPQGDYTVLTVQEDERSLIGARPSSKLFIERGLLGTKDFLSKLEGGANASFLGMLYLGGLLLCAGLMSLMMPNAKRFDLNPHLNVQGPLAVVVVSMGVSFVVTALFFLLSLAG